MEEEAARAAPLLQPRPRGEAAGAADTKAGRARRAAKEWWVESKKLWHIMAPAIFQRIALFAINVVTQAFIGHLGDLELAAFSIAATVVAGFNFGFLVRCARTQIATHSSLACLLMPFQSHARIQRACYRTSHHHQFTDHHSPHMHGDLRSSLFSVCPWRQGAGRSREDCVLPLRPGRN